MPLCRVRQAVECLSQRKMGDLRVQAGMVEWHAKHVASVSAASAEAGKAISSWELMSKPESEPLTEDELEKVIFGEEENEGAADPRNDAAMDWLEQALQPMSPPPMPNLGAGGGG